ncbi:MAG: hypothetical protein H6Q71_2909 [Firmicutes bacterium]|nr:hypothetical protein [Bacillota bacterium]
MDEVALATSGNPNEAQNAMLKAQEIMVNNGISMKEVSGNDKKQAVESEAKSGKRFPWYAYDIAASLADNFRCYSIINRSKHGRSINFVGLKSDVEAVIEVYNFALVYLDWQIKEFRGQLKSKLIADNGMINAYCNDFIRGFISGLDEKFKQQVEKQQWGLVLVKDEAVETYYEELQLGKARDRSVSSANSRAAYQAGYEKGRYFEMVAGELE